MQTTQDRYPVFEANQVLTSGHLNDVFNYLDEQERLTRANLIGIGIVCGLEIRLSADSTVIHLAKGCGNTSLGYLVVEPEDVDLTSYRDYQPPAEPGYPAFMKDAVKQEYFQLWELLPAGEPNTKNLDATFLNDKAVLLFLELKKQNLRNCSPINCDDKGSEVTAIVKRLAINRTDLDAIIAAANNLKTGLTTSDLANFLLQRINLPDIGLPRIDIPNSNLATSNDVLAAFLNVFCSRQLASNTGNALSMAYSAFKPLLQDTYPDDPFSGFSANFGFLDSVPATTVQVRFLQYYYDLFDDLLRAYDEFRWKGIELIGACCPNEGLFPCHLMLGILNPPSQISPAIYRQEFLPSPAISGCTEVTQELQQLFLRLVEMINQFTNVPDLLGAAGKLGLDPQIRIIPSVTGAEALADRAIPYYYRQSGTPPLYQLWSHKKTRRSRANHNLSYRSDEYSPAAPAFVGDPLSYDLEPYNFLRIEGHLGKDYQSSLRTLLFLKAQYRLPIEVLALRSGTFDENIAVDPNNENCRFQDLEALYEALREDLLSSLAEGVRYLYDIPLDPGVNPPVEVSSYKGGVPKHPLLTSYAPNFVTKDGTLGAWYESNLDAMLSHPYIDVDQAHIDPNAVLGVYCQLFFNIKGPLAPQNQPDAVSVFYFTKLSEAVPTRLDSLAHLDFENRYQDMTSLLRFFQSPEAKNIPGTLSSFIPNDDLIDHFDEILFTCKPGPIKSVYDEYTRRLREVKKKQFLGPFLQNNPGIQHKAGVPLGGTFILVYHQNRASTQDAGIVLSSGPSVSSWASGRLDVFVRGTDNALWHKWYAGGWSNWESLGGVLTSDPAAVSWGNGRIDVFVRGTDNALWHKWYAGGWSNWESLGGVLSSGPAVSSWASGRLDVFVRGTDNALWHKWYAGGWSNWESLGGVLTSDPAAVSWGNGRIDVFVRGTDNALWHKWFDNAWSNWESLGGVLSSGPAVSSWASGRLDVFVRGTDNALWHKWFENRWSNWESQGGVLTSSPAAVSWGNGRIDVFVRGTDSALWHKWYDNGWSGWELLGGILSTAPPWLSNVAGGAAGALSAPASGVISAAVDELPEGAVIADFYLPYLCCTDSAGVQFVLQEPRPTFTAKVDCTGLDGSAPVTVTATGGAHPYEIMIDQQAYTPLGDTLQLNAGSHTLTIRDANGTESNTQTITITAPLTIAGNPEFKCSADFSTYTVTFAISGGVAPYKVNDNAIVGNGYTTAPVSSGQNVHIKIEDSNGCAYTTDLTYTCAKPCDLPCNGIALRRGYRFWLPELDKSFTYRVLKIDSMTFSFQLKAGDAPVDISADVAKISPPPAADLNRGFADVVGKWLDQINSVIAQKAQNKDFLLLSYESSQNSGFGTLWIEYFECLTFNMEVHSTVQLGDFTDTLALRYDPAGTTAASTTWPPSTPAGTTGLSNFKILAGAHPSAMAPTRVTIPAFDVVKRDKCNHTGPVALCANVPPIAFDVSPLSVVANQPATFTVTAAAGSQPAYLWEMADALHGIEYMANGTQFTFTFATSVPQTIRVTAFTQNGCRTTKDFPITVNNPLG